ncbi:hypothetical protein FF1_043755 [Malus domestica]
MVGTYGDEWITELWNWLTYLLQMNDNKALLGNGQVFPGLLPNKVFGFGWPGLGVMTWVCSSDINVRDWQSPVDSYESTTLV